MLNKNIWKKTCIFYLFMFRKMSECALLMKPNDANVNTAIYRWQKVCPWISAMSRDFWEKASPFLTAELWEIGSCPLLAY